MTRKSGCRFSEKIMLHEEGFGGLRPMDKIPMTAAGYSALEAELKHCQQVERPRIIQQITDARTHGDLSENAEYHAAKESQSLNEGRIAELEDKLARAEV